MAAYAVLKPSTTASDLTMLPSSFADWLDVNYNFRTFVMAAAISIGPAVVLMPRRQNVFRRQILALVLLILVGMECAQLWIPSRGFSWADIAYTILGVSLCEAVATLMQRRSPRQRGSANDGHLRYEPKPEPRNSLKMNRRAQLATSRKLWIATICVILIAIQIVYLIYTVGATPTPNA